MREIWRNISCLFDSFQTSKIFYFDEMEREEDYYVVYANIVLDVMEKEMGTMVGKWWNRYGFKPFGDVMLSLGCHV